MTKWKPKVGDIYYIPWVSDLNLDYLEIVWGGYHRDEKRYAAGFVCRTKEEALELARKMLLVAEDNNEEECNEVAVEKHKLKEAAKMIRDYCAHTECSKCIFDYYGECIFVNINDPDNFYHRPWNWETHAIIEE